MNDIWMLEKSIFQYVNIIILGFIFRILFNWNTFCSDFTDIVIHWCPVCTTVAELSKYYMDGSDSAGTLLQADIYKLVPCFP